jgi:6-phosphofructokinase 1
MKKIALLTSGGDSPGMNAAVRAIVKSALYYGIQPIGIKDGFEGLMKGWGRLMSYDDVDNIIHLGGTVLGSARSKAFRTKEGRQRAIDYIQTSGIEGLVVIGGDGSFAGAKVLSEEMDLKIIGLPGTIDNDLFGTESSIGYDTALNTVVQSIDKIRDTASSHNRIFFIEVMGRDSGFLALNSAIASGAESVLIPETVTDLKALIDQIKNQNKGKRSSIIVVAEGDDAGGAVDIMRKVAPHFEGYDLRTTILGHIQRGGSPTFLDRSIATRSGVKAVELLRAGESGLMVGVKSDQLVTITIKDAIEKHATPDVSKEDLLQILRTGSFRDE